ncbi:unnamed protein product [Peronospora belbahrii]|uniref:F-box domain-containing protein n=1 Tax=Peronospora belbahrii TaxID=622444 RepID=A0AAU9KKX3_9STRA|nr:unnamed protein product [Peronospora belbahrii]
MKLCDLPRDLVAAILQFTDHTSLQYLEAVNHHVWDIILHYALWKILAQRMALITNLTRTSIGWKRLALLTQRPVYEELTVLRQVRVVADDPIAFNAIAKRLQLECGCARERPCYWSSASTWRYVSTDHLDYTLWENCLVNSVQVIPYRVFWYPGSPTYSPKRVSFAFYELGENGEMDTLVYESMMYSIAKDMKMETFELPCRIFFGPRSLAIEFI